MRGSTFTLGPSRFNRRNAGKISLFVSLSPFSLSLSLSDSVLSFSFLFFPYLPALPSLVCFIIIYFHFFPFSFFFFSFYLLSLIFFFFIFSFGFPSLVWIKWGKRPPAFLLGHLSSPCFSSLFSFSLLLHHVTHGLM